MGRATDIYNSNKNTEEGSTGNGRASAIYNSNSGSKNETGRASTMYEETHSTPTAKTHDELVAGIPNMTKVAQETAPLGKYGMAPQRENTTFRPVTMPEMMAVIAGGQQIAERRSAAAVDADQLEKDIAQKRAEVNSLRQQQDELYRSSSPEVVAMRESTELSLGKAQDELTALLQQQEKTQQAQSYYRYADMQGNADFAEKSQFVQQPIDPYDALNNRASLYDFVNDKNGARQKIASEYERGPSFLYGDWTPYAHLSEDEKGVFNYIYATEGEGAAKEYLDYLAESLTARQGADIAERMKNAGTVSQALYGVTSGVNQFGSGIQRTIQRTFAENPQMDTTAVEYATNNILNDLSEEGKKGAEFAFKVAQMAGQMAPSILLSGAVGSILKSAGLGAKALGIARNALFSGSVGASSSGNAYKTGIEQYGMTHEQAQMYANLVGASEGGLTYLLGGIGQGGALVNKLLGGNGAAKFAAKVANIDNALVRFVRQFGRQLLPRMGGEVIEENLQLVLEPAFRTILTGEDYDAPEINEIIETTLLSAVTSGLMSAPSAVGAAMQGGRPTPTPTQQNAPELRAEDLLLGVNPAVSENAQNAAESPAIPEVETVAENNAEAQSATGDVKLSPVEQTVQQDEVRRQEAPQYVPEGMGAASAGFNGAFNQWQNETPGNEFHDINENAISQTMDERGRAPVEVPKVNLDGKLTSKTASTLANANITTNEFAQTLENLLANGKFSRMAYSDDAAMQNAESAIRDKGYDRAKADYLASVRDGKSSKDVTALGISLYNAAVNAGNAVDALDIANAMIYNAKNTARALQAMNIINKLSPSAQLYGLAQSVENLQESMKKRYGDGMPDLVINKELAQQFINAETEQERAAIEKEILKDVGRQMPSNWKDKFNAWRYMAMLFNLRTHARNFGGNLGFAPIRAAKNVVAAGVETLFDKQVSAHGGRSTSVLNRFDAEDRARLALGKQVFKEVEDTILSGGKYDESGWDAVQEGRRIFKFFPFEAIRKLNTKALNVEDLIFSRPAFAGALARYLKANNITAEQFLSHGITDAQRQEALAKAINEAQKATYRDLNAFSELISGLRIDTDKNTTGTNAEKALRYGAHYLVEGAIPFKRTPANILVRAVEYSPAGLARGVKNLAFDVKSGKLSASEAIDRFASGFTGTALLAVGALLSHLDLLTGGPSGDDKQDEFDKLQGEQNYALSIGSDSYTLDWLAPEALPLFVGAELYRNFFADGEKKSLWDFVDAMLKISEPMLEMSMLQSLNDMLDSRNSETPGLSVVSSAATSYLMQFIPTLSGQIERAFTEDTRRETYIDRDSEMPSNIQYLLGRTLNKLPKEFNQIDYVDAWGRKQSTGDTGDRMLQNFLSPGTYAEDRGTPMDDELQRLYDAGFTNVFPKRAEKDTKVNNKYLSGAEYELFQTVKGETSYDMLESFMQTDSFAGMSDAAKAEFIDDVYRFATEMAKDAVAADRGEEFDNQYEDEAALPDVAEYFGVKSAFAVAADTAHNRENFDAFAVEALLGDYNALSDESKAALENTTTHSRLDDIAAANAAGISVADWDRAYDEFKRIDENSSIKNSEKPDELSYWLSKQGFTSKQQSLLKEQFGYWGMNRYDSGKLDAVASVVGDKDAAKRFDDKVDALTPPYGKTRVDNYDIYYLALNDFSSTQTQMGVIELYMPETTFAKMERAVDAGYTPKEFITFMDSKRTYSKKNDLINWATSHGYTKAEAEWLYKLSEGTLK